MADLIISAGDGVQNFVYGLMWKDCNTISQSDNCLVVCSNGVTYKFNDKAYQPALDGIDQYYDYQGDD